MTSRDAAGATVNDEGLRAAAQAVSDWFGDGPQPGVVLDLRAALASSPAPAGLDVEPDPWNLIHDNGFSWDDVNALASIFTHYGLDITRAATRPAEEGKK